MQATVFVEKVGKKKYRATTSQPLSLETEGASQDEACLFSDPLPRQLKTA
jgi:hypothetical protein